MFLTQQSEKYRPRHFETSRHIFGLGNKEAQVSESATQSLNPRGRFVRQRAFQRQRGHNSSAKPAALANQSAQLGNIGALIIRMGFWGLLYLEPKNDPRNNIGNYLGAYSPIVHNQTFQCSGQLQDLGTSIGAKRPQAIGFKVSSLDLGSIMQLFTCRIWGLVFRRAGLKFHDVESRRLGWQSLRDSFLHASKKGRVPSSLGMHASILSSQVS